MLGLTNMSTHNRSINRSNYTIGQSIIKAEPTYIDLTQNLFSSRAHVLRVPSIDMLGFRVMWIPIGKWDWIIWRNRIFKGYPCQFDIGIRLVGLMEWDLLVETEMDGATSCPARLSSACTRTVPLSCPGLSDFNIVMTKVWDVYYMSPPSESVARVSHFKHPGRPTPSRYVQALVISSI